MVISHAPLVLWANQVKILMKFFLARYNVNHAPPLAQLQTVQYNLRQRTHDLILPTDVNAIIKQSFVYRMLFSDIY